MKNFKKFGDFDRNEKAPLKILPEDMMKAATETKSFESQWLEFVSKCSLKPLNEFVNRLLMRFNTS
jgi:hypothetical protein